jgi:hypothetical protein
MYFKSVGFKYKWKTSDFKETTSVWIKLGLILGGLFGMSSNC